MPSTKETEYKLRPTTVCCTYLHNNGSPSDISRVGGSVDDANVEFRVTVAGQLEREEVLAELLLCYHRLNDGRPKLWVIGQRGKAHTTQAIGGEPANHEVIRIGFGHPEHLIRSLPREGSVQSVRMCSDRPPERLRGRLCHSTPRPPQPNGRHTHR